MKNKPNGYGYPVRYDVVETMDDGTEDVWSFYNQDMALELMQAWRTENPTSKYELREVV